MFVPTKNELTNDPVQISTPKRREMQAWAPPQTLAQAAEYSCGLIQAEEAGLGEAGTVTGSDRDLAGGRGLSSRE